MYRRVPSTTVCALAICLTAGRGLEAQDCDAFAKAGWFNTASITNTLDLSRRFTQQLRASKVNTLSEARSFGLNATVPIEGILVGLGLESSEAGYKHLLEWSDTQLSDAFSQRSMSTQFTRTVDPGVVKAVYECLLNDGVHAWNVMSSADAQQMVIAARFSGYHPFADARVRVTPSRPSVRCEPSSLRIYAGAVQQTVCTRAASDSTETYITVTAEGGRKHPEGRQFLFPARRASTALRRCTFLLTSLKAPVGPGGHQIDAFVATGSSSNNRDFLTPEWTIGINVATMRIAPVENQGQRGLSIHIDISNPASTDVRDYQGWLSLWHEGATMCGEPTAFTP